MFQIFINDEEVVCESSFDIEEQLANPSSIVLSKVFPKKWKGTDKLLTDYYFPKDYSRCKILRNGELYFLGIVKNSADMVIDPRKPHYCSLQILDYSTLLSEGDVLDYVIVNKTVSEAINQVVDSISKYGFVVGNIQIKKEYDTVIGAYSTSEKAPYDVFYYLSQISQSRWSTRLVDEDTIAIDFIDYDLVLSTKNIENKSNFFNENKIIDISYSYSTSDYRNKQIITSEEVFGNVEQNQTLIADGFNKSFKLEQKIGSINAVKKNGITQTVITKEEYDLGISCDFYFTLKNDTIESVDTISSGNVIEVSYIPIIKGREIAVNSGEISRIGNSLKVDGTIARYENRSDVTNSKELLAVGNSYIKYKGKPEIEITILSEKDFLTLGSKYYYDAPINDLKNYYLITKKVTKVIQSGDFYMVKYEYTLSNSYDTENEINFFDNQRSKNSGNIGEGETVTRNIDIINTTNIIFSGLNIEEISVIGDNILNSSLNSPLNN